MSTSIAGTSTLPLSAADMNTQTPPSPITPRLRRNPPPATSSPGAGPSRSPRTTRSSAAPPSPVVPTSKHRSSTAKKHVAVEVEEKTSGPMYLQPAEFFPLNNGAGGKYVSPWKSTGQEEQWLSPEDDPDAKRGIPIFRPTMEEFKDFEGYVTKTVPWGQYSGIAKIIPPPEWTGALPAISKETLSNVRIKSPIQQTMLGRSGLFRVTNVEKRRQNPLDIREWFDKCQNKTFVGPGPKDVDRALDRDSKAAKERAAQAKADMTRQKAERREKLAAAKKRKEERESMGGGGSQAGKEADEEDHDNEEEMINSQSHQDPSADDVPALEHSPHSSTDSDPHARTPESQGLDPFYENFDPKTAWLPHDTQPEDYTPEACSNMEKKFWKSLLTREPSWYGADLQGSLFADKSTPWNVSCLPNLLNRCALTKKLPGVNSPYLYFGMYGATFAWHVEDMDLFSINYIHFGAPKFWYAVPQRHADRFEHTLAGYFPQDAQRCDQFLRHKSFTMSPTQLANDKIPVNMLVHNQNEYVITYPRGYHAGFNMGFNCAESINFALESWLELGKRAKVCECVEHSVRINVDEMLAERELVEVIEEARTEAKPRAEPRPRKRKAEGEEHTPKPRKIRIVQNNETPSDIVDLNLEEHETTLPVNGLDYRTRKIKITKEMKPVIIKEVVSYPCLFCPSLSTEDLRPVYDPTEVVKAHSQSLDKTTIMAHHSCALGIPEVGIQDIDVAGVPVLHIVGAERIEAARWKLKCSSCQDKKLRATGAKVQCTKSKSCVKAYHVSCAKDDPKVQYQVHEVLEWPAPVEGADPAAPVEPSKTIKIELLCESHNPAQIAIRRAQGLEDLKQKILALPIDSQLKVKSKGGGYMYGSLVRVLVDSAQVEVRLETGQKYWVPFDRIEFKETKPKLQVDEYARTYNTKAKEPIPSRSIAVPPTPTKPDPRAGTSVATPLQALPRISPPQAQNRKYASGPRPDPAGPSTGVPYNPRPISYGPPPLGPPPGVMYHSYPQYAPAPYMMDSRIPTRVVVCDSAQPTWVSVDHQPNGHHGYSHGAPPPHYAPRQSWPPAHGQYMPGPPNQPVHTSGHLGQPVHASGNVYVNRPQPRAQVISQPVSAVHLSVPGMAGYESKGPPQVPSGSRADKIDLTLEHMRRLMGHLPPLRIPAIHLAGTNGKGSVSAIIDSILTVAGLRTARYNSPHLIEPRDACRIAGVPPPKGVYNSAMATIRHIAGQRQIEVSPFEIATAAAYYIFATAQPPIDVMIIECGMGGVNDATNVMSPAYNLASGLTSVGLDHTTFLGDSIAAIADQKARITVPGGLLVTAPNLAPEAMQVAHGIGYQLRAAVIESGYTEVLEEDQKPFSLSPFVPPQSLHVRTRLPVILDGRLVPGEDYIATRLPLAGQHQLDNLSLALTIVHVLSHDKRALSIQPALSRVNPPIMQRGVELTRWGGRCSWLKYKVPHSDRSVPLLVDGAHNADSAKTLRAYINQLGSGVKVHFVISLSASPGKSPESVLRPLLAHGDKVTLVDFTTPVEGMPWVKPAGKEEVRDVVNTLISGEAEIVGQSGVEGLKGILGGVGDDTLVVICGSLYLVADIYRLASSA